MVPKTQQGPKIG